MEASAVTPEHGRVLMSVQYAVSSWSAAVLRRLPCRAIELLFACRDVCLCRRRIDFERPKFLVSNLFAERDQALFVWNVRQHHDVVA